MICAPFTFEADLMTPLLNNNRRFFDLAPDLFSQALQDRQRLHFIADLSIVEQLIYVNIILNAITSAPT